MNTENIKNIIKYNYKSTDNIDYWEEYLERELTRKELIILSQARSECLFNNKINKVFEKGKTMGLYIPELTELHGNCIFESLKILGLCEDIDAFRTSIALSMFILKDKKNLIINEDGSNSQSLFELFNDFKEIHYVFCQEDKKIYKYNFDVMCMDLATDTSWTRFNTHLILLFLASLLNLKFTIIQDSGYVHDIGNITNPDTKTIYLGHIGELHYIPLDVGETEEQCPKYINRTMMFHEWAKLMAQNMNRVEY